MPEISDDPKGVFHRDRMQWEIVTVEMRKRMRDWKIMQRFIVPNVLVLKMWDAGGGEYYLTGESIFNKTKAQIFKGPLTMAEAAIAYDDAITTIAARIISAKEDR